jgi:uncharacterized protein YcbK (DUF882 family)
MAFAAAHPRLRLVALASAVLLIAGTGDAAPSAGRSPSSPLPTKTWGPNSVARIAPRGLEAASPSLAVTSWAAALPPIDVVNRNTNARAKVRLYANDGGIDRDALHTFMRVAASVPSAASANAEPLEPRLVQLAIRASYHFGGRSIMIVSATRRGATGKHRSGHALDFKLEGVSAAELAAYARRTPRAGVGIYTHPKTQYIHLDVRDRSYHWIDGSPPGVTWREQLLRDESQAKRDASYAAAMDLPEAAR